MLWRVHATGSCHDTDHVADVLAGHGADSEAVRELIARHAQRCPSAAADASAHEYELARFHRMPRPMFMATARIDALWVHDGLLDARDYKTGRLWHTRVCDVPAAKVQAYVLGRAAQRRGLRLRLRYEYLQPEIDEDPEPWEPDDDDLLAVEEELRARRRADVELRRLAGRQRRGRVPDVSVPLDLSRQRGARRSRRGRSSRRRNPDH